MQHYWPDQPRFSAENFGNQPLWLVVQALEWGAKIRHEELHLQELGIAQLTAIYFNSKRDSKQEALKESEFYHFAPQDGPQISPLACDTFFSLSRDGLLPGWAIALAPINQMRSRRANGAVPQVRAWLGTGILILNPRIRGSQVYSPFVLIDESVLGVCHLQNLDTEKPFVVQVPAGEPRYVLDAVLDIPEAEESPAWREMVLR